ncbi:hypothetical protein LIER_43840 [Lithospermum erythrorhizon]|uniref:Uncharacterized protein n=1 Tax=Lithospermum erythrorhizon TaxID=34254 RepID=A0AAV3QYH6_LITER
MMCEWMPKIMFDGGDGGAWKRRWGRVIGRRTILGKLLKVVPRALTSVLWRV